MNKIYMLMLSGIVCPIALRAQQPTVINLNFPIQHADASVIDFDNDGKLDILISGENDSGKALQAFKNNGDGTFTTVSVPFAPVTRASIDWNDIDQDGKPDVILSGSIDYNGTTDKSVEIYTSDGAGNFSSKAISGLTAVAPGCGFADLNNDGYVDFYVFGNIFQGESGFYINNKAGGFTKTEFTDYDLVDPDVTPVDFDNDGDLDLFLMGKDNTTSTYVSVMLVNTNGVFAAQSLGITPRGDGSAVWGDVDGDGRLDLLINGNGDWDGTETTGDVVRLYRNNAGTFTKVATFQQYGQGSTGDGLRFADWNNDGKLDVIVSGWSANQNRQAADIYLNNGDLTFTPYAYNNNIPGVGESSIEVGDINNDGKIDLVVTGTSYNNYGPGDLGGKASAVVLNPTTTANAAPTAPAGLSVASNNPSEITLSWNAATDDSTPANSLSYNIFVKDANGVYYYYPLADESTGRLLLPRMGNVQFNKSWTIKNLPDGAYTWGVQAVDNSFAASTFATGTFTINGGVLPVTLQQFSTGKENNRVKLQWVTAAESNNSHFEVEKSADGKNFAYLQSVAAQHQANTYTVYDEQPYNGVNYYRLKQVDTDGKETVLGVKAVDFGIAVAVTATVYPNPAVQDIRVKLSRYTGSALAVNLIDISGKVIYRQAVNSGVIDFAVNYQPAPGLYLLQLTGEGLNQQLKLLVK
ncbi:T9SS type A sorting domain-containing protein [Pedobacter sp. BS3]|uniref:T9SS type A sorting domain-containing protein n=1 Tax=Pedobacter sp. BS3 TaxID=2567937 RepID=UPI0011EEAA3F|nr:T9SS type A sorting domain-containing protein [Pedobacter sp. BS3]TZF82086.1 T9SS type A sorting domain-containing protein [Pedobacter sp. BS3]